MRLLLNNGESTTVGCNHAFGNPADQHVVTITNYSGDLYIREFNQPAITEENFLTSLATQIMHYEDPTGKNCSNDVGCLLSIGDDHYEFDGEKLVKLKGIKFKKVKRK